MKILFFDMEFANGQVPGSIYSLGYLMTDENLTPIGEGRDIMINPDCVWNEYVETHILAYPKETVEASPKFPEVYEEIKALFLDADMAVGFAVNNDVNALRKDCERYGLEKIPYFYFDVEKLSKLTEEHKGAHGLAGCVTAWCGKIPENQHRSDGDAYATMLLFEAICKAKHADPEMVFDAYPDCEGESNPPERKKQPRQGRPNGRRRHHRPYGKGGRSKPKPSGAPAGKPAK